VAFSVYYIVRGGCASEHFKGAYSYTNVYRKFLPSHLAGASIGAGDVSSAITALKKRVDAYKPLPDGKDADGNIIKHSDEVYLKVCCQLALRSASLGNFGIGALIVDPLNKLKPHLKDATVVVNGQQTHYLSFVEKMLNSLGYNNPESDSILNKVVGVGLNQVFHSGFFGNDGKPRVRSDRHGEMVGMDLLEDAVSSVPHYEQEYQNRMPEGLKLYTQLESCPMCMSRLASSSISAVYHGAPDNGGGMVHKLCDLPPIFIGLTSVQTYAPAYISGNIKGDKKNSLIQLCFDCFGVNVATVGTKQNNRAYGCPQNCPEKDYCRPTTDPRMIKRMGYNLSGFTRF
jgi:tRNA(Arg) A34 adenosine deaminase TadA